MGKGREYREIEERKDIRRKKREKKNGRKVILKGQEELRRMKEGRKGWRMTLERKDEIRMKDKG